VDVRNDGQEVRINAFEIDYRRKVIHQAVILKFNEYGGVDESEFFTTELLSVDSHGRMKVQVYVREKEYDIFNINCAASAKKGLPDSVKKMFRGYYGLGNE
jgi:hypothetical protein